MSPVTPREALAELVALKALKDRIEGWSAGPTAAMREEYECRKPIAWDNARAALAAPEAAATPSGYAYRYPDGIRFNDGTEVNGCRPSESIPYWLGRSPAAAAPSDTPTCPQPIIDAITAYGDARADSNLDAGAAALGTAIRLIRAALAAAPAQPAAQVLASSDPEAHRQAAVDSEAEMWMAHVSNMSIKRAFIHEEDARLWLGSGIHRDGGVVPLVVAPAQPAAQGQQWISVEGRLPPFTHRDDSPLPGLPSSAASLTSDRVLVVSEGRIRITYLVGAEDSDKRDWFAASNVTHWMPLPAAPEAKP